MPKKRRNFSFGHESRGTKASQQRPNMARVAYGATSAADDDDDIRFGSMGYTTELSEDYVTTAQYMARDLDDPYAYEKKPIHYIPGYTGHLPLNRERFGVNYREASAATIAMQKSKGVHHPVTDLSAPAPNYVRATRTTRPPPAPHSSAELDGRREDGPCSREAMLPPPPWPSERRSLGCHDPTARPTRGPHRPSAPSSDLRACACVWQFGKTAIKKLNRSQKFIAADQVAQEEATTNQQKYGHPHAQAPFGVFPVGTAPGAMDYTATSSKVCPNNQADDPSSLASRIAHRRVARIKV
jgi:hypothetical protein